MSTFRDTVSLIVALVGAVAIYQSLGPLWLTAWTIGVLAVSHSRNWRGAFPGDDTASDERLELRPPHYGEGAGGVPAGPAQQVDGTKGSRITAA